MIKKAGRSLFFFCAECDQLSFFPFFFLELAAGISVPYDPARDGSSRVRLFLFRFRPTGNS